MSDEVREFVFNNYIAPAREHGLEKITIRAGDIHSRMNLRNRLPLVCSALGTIKFQEAYRVKLIAQDGPANGSNHYLTFVV